MVIKEDNIINAVEPYICHQVNCRGVMNSGVAKALREKYPIIYDYYKSIILKNKNLLGAIQLVPINKEQNIINMFAQSNFGHDGQTYTDYEAFQKCLKILKYSIPIGSSIAFPYKIGCGLGGGDWSIIKDMIEDTLQGYNIIFYKLKGE